MLAEPLEDRRMLATITVDTALDVIADDGMISLREAILAANSNTAGNNAPAGDDGLDTIDFAATLAGNTIPLGGTELEITEPITVDASALGRPLTIDARGLSRVFNITSTTGDFTLAGLTLTRGSTSGDNADADDSTFSGGAVRSLSAGNLTISRSRVADSQTTGASAVGGGVFSAGKLTLLNSTVSGNRTLGASATGGGVTALDLLTVTHSTISGNHTAGPGALGGGLFGRSSTAVTSSTIDGNYTQGQAAGGGGMFSAGYVEVTRSTISNNRTVGQDATGGGALVAFGNLSLNHSTISGNRTEGADSYGGGIAVLGDLTLDNSTVTGNQALGADAAGGGVRVLGTATIANSLVAANRDSLGMPDVVANAGAATVTFTLIGDNSGSGLTEAPLGSPDTNGNLIGSSTGGGVIDPRLAPLADNGGPTQTHALMADSPAIDAGNPTPTQDLGQFDQRGVPFVRVFDADNTGGARLDMGAVEVQTVLDSFFLVTTLDDEDDGDLSAGDVSLREAIAAANNSPGADTIFFAEGTRGTLQLTLGHLAITEGLTIRGPGASELTLVGNSRIFDFTHPTDDLLLADMTLTGGSTSGNNAPGFADNTYSGGAVRSISSGNLTITGAVLTGNQTTGSHARGGAVFSAGDVLLTNTTVSNNSTQGEAASGGGVFAAGSLTLTNSTIDGNRTQGRVAKGGGVQSLRDVTLTNSTISGNRTENDSAMGGGVSANRNVVVSYATITGNRTTGANADGGGVYAVGELAVANSIVAGNRAAAGKPDLGTGGTLNVRFSLIGNQAGTGLTEAPLGSPDANGNLVGGAANGIIDPMLEPLAENGGPTRTHNLKTTSPALDAGDPNAAPGVGNVPAVDQRGAPFERVFDGDNNGTPRIDMGALELFALFPDRFELNNSQGTATNLGSLPTLLERDLTIHAAGDQDFFKVTARDTGKLIVRTLFAHAAGDLDLEILDMAGNQIAIAMASTTDVNQEQLVIPVVAREMYFVRVFGAGDATNAYDLEIEHFAAPVPTGLQLDPPSDLGRLNTDLLTSDATPNIVIQTDVLGFIDENRNNAPDTGEITVLTAAQAAARDTSGVAVEVTLINTSDPTQTPIVAFANPLITTFPTVYTFEPATSLPDGVYFATAKTVAIDGQMPTQLGRSGISPPLRFTVDTVPPAVFFGTAALATDGLDAASDTGVDGEPATLVDRITSDTTPTLFGRTEASALVRVFVRDNNGNRVPIGETVATPFNGNNPAETGQWSLTSSIDLNDPQLGFATRDGLRRLEVEAEDVAGNTTAAPAEMLDLFIDTQGPQVASIRIADSTFDLLAPKPAAGPTPAVGSLQVGFSDLPNRLVPAAAGEPDFQYAAVSAAASDPLRYQLVGDRVGRIAIASIDLDAVGNSNNAPAAAIARLNFAAPLPDDRYTLTILDTLTDPAGNRLDGESQAAELQENRTFPSGDGLPGGDFVARFTVDSRAEIGTWGAGNVLIDTNGNFLLDPGGQDATNRDLAYLFGLSADNVLAGNFVREVSATADGFDKLAVYGRVGVGGSAQWRWLIDFDNDGVPEAGFNDAPINGIPVAGNFDGNATNGDEVGVFDGTRWYLDTDHDFLIGDEAPITANYVGYPIAGDFDGDGNEDLGTYQHNQFFIDLGRDGTLDFSFGMGTTGREAANGYYGFPGIRERPVAADFDADGIDDIGLWVPDGVGSTPVELAQWYLLTSGDNPATENRETVLTRIVGGTLGGFVPFSHTPLGNDLFAQFGDRFAAPIVGNFDPPLSATTANQLREDEDATPAEATRSAPAASVQLAGATPQEPLPRTAHSRTINPPEPEPVKSTSAEGIPAETTPTSVTPTVEPEPELPEPELPEPEAIEAGVTEHASAQHPGLPTLVPDEVPLLPARQKTEARGTLLENTTTAEEQSLTQPVLDVASIAPPTPVITPPAKPSTPIGGVQDALGWTARVPLSVSRQTGQEAKDAAGGKRLLPVPSAHDVARAIEVSEEPVTEGRKALAVSDSTLTQRESTPASAVPLAAGQQAAAGWFRIPLSLFSRAGSKTSSATKPDLVPSDTAKTAQPVPASKVALAQSTTTKTGAAAVPPVVLAPAATSATSITTSPPSTAVTRSAGALDIAQGTTALPATSRAVRAPLSASAWGISSTANWWIVEQNSAGDRGGEHTARDAALTAIWRW
jgi:CSLREA domain-containing protein